MMYIHRLYAPWSSSHREKAYDPLQEPLLGPRLKMADSALNLTPDDDGDNDETTTLQSLTSAGITPPTKTMDSRKKPTSQQAAFSTFFQHLTTTAHACILLYVILIIYFSFSADFQFFTWHPLLLSVGWMFLMTEAILSLSKENLFTGTLPKGIRVRLHWIFQTIACILITIGFVVVYINKDYLNKQHFMTWHGLLGLIGLIFCIPSCLNGIAALYHGSLRQLVRPKIIKFVHILSGIVSFGFGGAALILSVYTKWFERHSNGNIVTFLLGLAFVSIAVVWTLVRPVITCCRQLKHLM
ncbi:transmembrane reductase CYB561D2 [Tribolium madens]|uniref:transmembrane reductase CYB561D2 n=1 Tax=Tribolium madens TaxID=41895 RepID=UPI001CF7413A|nr:transmembrane reductase CYB561D2 [Tribolium madens]